MEHQIPTMVEAADGEQLEEPLILNRYRPLEEAGAGSFGTVQLAWDTRIQRRVAVKCMQLEALTDETGEPIEVAQLNPADIPSLNEARTAALLTNPNIVSVYDFEVQGQTAYLIMEYMDGLTLADLLRTVGDDMTLDMATAVFDGVSQALEFAHENQVLHLDIKPDNVLIDHQGQVKVTDFGLSRLSDAQGYSAAVGGTIGYMPPEQIMQEPLDERCDEWALASMTYEMLAGKNPFLAKDLSAAMTTIENAEIVLPSLCMNGLSAEADDVLFYALDPDREERYAMVADFAEELGKFLGDKVHGRKELATTVRSICDDERPVTASGRRSTFFDCISGKAKAVLMRVWSVLNLAVLGFATLSTVEPLGGWGSPACWGVFALLLLAGALVPHIGAILALTSLAAALLLNGAYVLGGVVVVASIAWWFGIARIGSAHANTALTPCLVGTFGFNQVVPLLCGFFLSVREAAINAAFAGLLALSLAGLGSLTFMGWNVLVGTVSGEAVQQNVLTMLTRPSTWVIAISWLAAAAVTAALCSRRKRALSLVGALCGGAILAFGICLATFFTSGFVNWMPSAEMLVPTILAAAIMAGVSFLGTPERAKYETERFQQERKCPR